MQENTEALEIDIKRIAWALWNRLWIILIVGVVCASLALSYAWFFITPTYSASTQLYVNNYYGDNTPGFSSSQLTAAQSLANTYMVIMKSRTVLEDVQKQTGLDYSLGQLNGMISAQAVNETEVFQITVTCADYQHAAIIANAVADVLPDRIAAVVDGSSVRVVDYAVENPNPVGPSYKRNAMIGALVGIMLTAVFVVISEFMDTSVNSEEYLTHTYKNIPLLAVIPNAEGTKNGNYNYYYRSYRSHSKESATQQKGGDQE